VWTSKSSAPESAEVTERNSSRTENPVAVPLVVDNQEEEKMEGPNALERPPVGKVKEPDLSRLFLSVTFVGATGGATDVEE
jgi:hypothetical protein